MAEYLMGIADIFFRSIVSAGILLLLTKLMGFKQLSQLTLFDYVIGISIGSIAGEMAFDRDIPYHYFVIAMIVYCAIALCISLATLKSIKARRYLTGSPVVIIDRGKLLDQNMKTVKLDINDLLSQCRNAGYFHITDIEFAIMEPNGIISFLPKSQNRPLTPQDMSIQVKQEEPAPSLVIDGKLMTNNLSLAGLTEDGLRSQLLAMGITKPENIFFATFDSNDQLQVYLRNPIKTKHNQFT